MLNRGTEPLTSGGKVPDPRSFNKKEQTMLREMPDSLLGDQEDYERWLFESQCAEWEGEERQDRSEPTSIVSAVLANAEEKRFNKAAKGLREGLYTVQFTHLSPGIVSAYVTNGDKQPYG